MDREYELLRITYEILKECQKPDCILSVSEFIEMWSDDNHDGGGLLEEIENILNKTEF